MLIRIATNFDWYFPEYAYRHSPKQVRKWFNESKLRITHFNEMEHSELNFTKMVVVCDFSTFRAPCTKTYKILVIFGAF